MTAPMPAAALLLRIATPAGEPAPIATLWPAPDAALLGELRFLDVEQRYCKGEALAAVRRAAGTNSVRLACREATEVFVCPCPGFSLSLFRPSLP